MKKLKTLRQNTEKLSSFVYLAYAGGPPENENENENENEEYREQALEENQPGNIDTTDERFERDVEQTYNTILHEIRGNRFSRTPGWLRRVLTEGGGLVGGGYFVGFTAANTVTAALTAAAGASSAGLLAGGVLGYLAGRRLIRYLGRRISAGRQASRMALGQAASETNTENANARLIEGFTLENVNLHDYLAQKRRLQILQRVRERLENRVRGEKNSLERLKSTRRGGLNSFVHSVEDWFSRNIYGEQGRTENALNDLTIEIGRIETTTQAYEARIDAARERAEAYVQHHDQRINGLSHGVATELNELLQASGIQIEENEIRDTIRRAVERGENNFDQLLNDALINQKSTNDGLPIHNFQQLINQLPPDRQDELRNRIQEIFNTTVERRRELNEAHLRNIDRFSEEELSIQDKTDKEIYGTRQALNNSQRIHLMNPPQAVRNFFNLEKLTDFRKEGDGLLFQKTIDGVDYQIDFSQLNNTGNQINRSIVFHRDNEEINLGIREINNLGLRFNNAIVRMQPLTVSPERIRYFQKNLQDLFTLNEDTSVFIAPSPPLSRILGDSREVFSPTTEEVGGREIIVLSTVVGNRQIRFPNGFAPDAQAEVTAATRSENLTVSEIAQSGIRFFNADTRKYIDDHPEREKATLRARTLQQHAGNDWLASGLERNARLRTFLSNQGLNEDQINEALTNMNITDLNPTADEVALCKTLGTGEIFQIDYDFRNPGDTTISYDGHTIDCPPEEIFSSSLHLTPTAERRANGIMERLENIPDGGTIRNIELPDQVKTNLLTTFNGQAPFNAINISPDELNTLLQGNFTKAAGGGVEIMHGQAQITRNGTNYDLRFAGFANQADPNLTFGIFNANTNIIEHRVPKTDLINMRWES